MPMTQEDIRHHYEVEWRQKSESASSVDDLGYSQALCDRMEYPRYARLIADLGMRVNGGRVLDVGAGSGRWVRAPRGRVPRGCAGPGRGGRC